MRLQFNLLICKNRGVDTYILKCVKGEIVIYKKFKRIQKIWQIYVYLFNTIYIKYVVLLKEIFYIN